MWQGNFEALLLCLERIAHGLRTSEGFLLHWLLYAEQTADATAGREWNQAPRPISSILDRDCLVFAASLSDTHTTWAQTSSSAGAHRRAFISFRA